MRPEIAISLLLASASVQVGDGQPSSAPPPSVPVVVESVAYQPEIKPLSERITYKGLAVVCMDGIGCWDGATGDRLPEHEPKPRTDIPDKLSRHVVLYALPAPPGYRYTNRYPSRSDPWAWGGSSGSTQPVPAPGVLGLMLAGLLGLIATRRARRLTTGRP